MANRKINKKKITKLIIILVVIIIIGIGIIIGIKLLEKGPELTENSKVIDTVNDYKLDDSETEYYKSLFKELKTILSETEVNNDQYAKVIGQLFLTDFFTLDNKANKNDIGGTQYIYKPFQSDFEKLARDTIYHGIENNLFGNRDQELPIVYSVDVVNSKQDKYEYLDKNDDNAYYIDFIIRYEKDLEYQEEATLILIHNGERLEIAEMLEKKDKI